MNHEYNHDLDMVKLSMNSKQIEDAIMIYKLRYNRRDRIAGTEHFETYDLSKSNDVNHDGEQ